MNKLKFCRSTMVFGDDYGDNITTFHCELPPKHEGDHQERGQLYQRQYIVKWAQRRELT